MAVRDFDGPRSAVESAFSRLAAGEALVRVRKGLCWKGAATALGMSPPRVEEVALAVGGPCGRRGGLLAGAHVAGAFDVCDCGAFSGTGTLAGCAVHGAARAAAAPSSA